MMKRSFVLLVKIFLLFQLFSILLLYTGCSKRAEQEKGDITYPLETAKLVSEIPAAVISPTEPIQIRFVAPVIDENLVGQLLLKKVFRFMPDIEGIAKWQDVRTLIFQPANPFPLRREYSGELNLQSLLPGHKAEKMRPLRFKFRVAGREIVSVKGDFKLQKSDDPRFLTYVGEILFSEPAPLSEVKKSVSLRRNGKYLTLTFEAAPDGKKFLFWSPVIERSKVEQKFVLSVDQKRLALSQDYRKEFVLPARTDLSVAGINIMGDGEKKSLVIRFSDDLDPQKDIRGLVRIDPQIKIELRVMGKEVHVKGDFRYGQTYTVHVTAGIRSRWATTTREEYSEKITIEDIKPEMRFAGDGVFMPSANRQKLNFMTVNLQRVVLNIKKVFASNLGQFLQTGRLSGGRKRNRNFNTWELRRVGVDIITDTLQIGYQPNEWLQHELDLKNILPGSEKGLFLISLSFSRKDMIYNGLNSGDEKENRRRRFAGRDYYSDPLSPGYIYQHGRIYKPVIFSDIGMICKSANDKFLVFATNIVDASPMKDVQVKLLTYQNQLIAEKSTDARGRVLFQSVNQDVFYVTGEKGKQRSVIKLNEMAWNLSGFDTGGANVKPDGIRAFIYTERGVYRPGDEINLALIARNRNQTFPDNHPVTLQITNPKKQVMLETVQKESRDGFYHFKFQSGLDDLTGNYQAKFIVGSVIFKHLLKIETMAPYRLKVKIEPEKKKLYWNDRQLRLNVNAVYLFGNPAANLPANVKVNVTSMNKSFAEYKNFLFTNEAVEYKPMEMTLFSGKLDSRGDARIAWEMPRFEHVPSALAVRITASVLEKGGRANRNFVTIPVDPYSYYVGLRKSAAGAYTRVGAALKIPAVLVDTRGKPAPGKTLTYRIYRNDYYWWWEYENRRNFRLHFKSDRNTRKIKEGTVFSQLRPVPIQFTPEEDGEYLIEVSADGHTAGFFFKAYFWGEVPSGGDLADILALRADKKSYYPGEKAIVRFPSPKEGKILVTVEKAYEIISANWYTPAENGGEMELSIPVTKELVPNAYLSVAIIQPHSQTVNDRPIRMYGVVPLMVTDSTTVQMLSIKTRDRFEPNKPFEVEIQAGKKEKTQYTVAVVDEGLLSLTRFRTPDPWKSFFKKQRLGVKTYDLFSYILDANKGDIFKTFSVGGDMEAAYRESQLQPEKNRRFKPVSMYRGPLFTDKNGHGKVRFNMPNYVGAVRIMAVSAAGSRYGSAEKTVPVQSKLMILPTLPRVLGPGDKITVPVTVFANEEKLGRVEVTIGVKGAVKISGDAKKVVLFPEKGEKDVQFQLEAEAAVGVAKIEIRASASGLSVRDTVNLAVRPSSPRIYESVEEECKPGETVSFVVPDRGIRGSNEAKISVRRRPKLNLAKRLDWLIHYPYGCIEQTVSAVFPQLYLKKLIEADERDAKDIDFFINAAIDRLHRFQLPSGAFSYWPGRDRPSIWGTNYAGHFLIEAKNLGYNVSSDLLNGWLKYETSQALLTKDRLMERVYRVYLLALSGKPQIGAMNLLKENNLQDMNDTEKWMLGSAYKLAGIEKTAWDIVQNAGFSVKNYREFGGTYGSGLRDKAILLDMLLHFERWQDARKIADELAFNLSSDTWFSTQTSGYMLLALGKYIRMLEGEGKSLITGSIKLPDGRVARFSTEEIAYTLQIPGGFGKPVTVTLDEKTSVKMAFVNLEWNGIPLKDDRGDLSENLTLSVEWLDEDGMRINAADLMQGMTFWGHFRAGKSAAYGGVIEELALTQVLPAGWEIQNIRLSGEDFPRWMSGWNLNRQEYTDIRDDRIFWFFDLSPEKKAMDFVVKLQAVTAGEFTLPPTIYEAMYNHSYRARKAGKTVKVTPKL